MARVAETYQGPEETIGLGPLWVLEAYWKVGKSTFLQSTPGNVEFLEVERESFAAAWNDPNCRKWLGKRGVEFPKGRIFKCWDWDTLKATCEERYFRPAKPGVDCVCIDHVTAVSEALMAKHKPYESQVEMGRRFGKIAVDFQWLFDGFRDKGIILIMASHLVDNAAKPKFPKKDAKTGEYLELEYTKKDLMIGPDVVGQTQTRILQRASCVFHLKRVGNGASAAYKVINETRDRIEAFNRYGLPPEMEDTDMRQMLIAAGLWADDVKSSKQPTKKGK